MVRVALGVAGGSRVITKSTSFAIDVGKLDACRPGQRKVSLSILGAPPLVEIHNVC